MSKLAQDLQVGQALLTDLIAEKKDLTSDLAARLALYFQTDPYFWINLQRNFDEVKIDGLIISSLRDQISPLLRS